MAKIVKGIKKNNSNNGVAINQLPSYEMVEISKITYNLDDNRKSGLDDASIQEFADTLKHDGRVHTPVLLEKKGETLRMVAGHRRLLASVKAGFSTIPAMVYTEISDTAAFNMQVSENLSRVDMSPIDKAIYMMVAKDRLKIKLEDVSAIFFKGRRDRIGDVSKQLSLLELSKENQDAVHRGEMTTTQAYALLKKGVSPEAQKIMGQIAGVVGSNPNTTKRTKQEQNKKAMEALANERPDLGLPTKTEKKTPNPLKEAADAENAKAAKADSKSGKKPTDIPAPEGPGSREDRKEAGSVSDLLGALNFLLIRAANFPVIPLLQGLKAIAQGEEKQPSREHLLDIAKSLEVVKKDPTPATKK